jgi:spore germination cell wall hydrolase CwlJ-like protein
MAPRPLSVLCIGVAMLASTLPMSSADPTTTRSTSAVAPPKSIEIAATKRTEEIATAIGATEKDELMCLVQAIYFEARSEPVHGQLAVGQVVLNRVASPHYPDTICGVVYQNAHLHNGCQFSFACDGQPETITERGRWREIVALARGLLACKAGCRETGARRGALWTSTHYHADYVSPTWAKVLQPTGQVGRHIFYNEVATGGSDMKMPIGTVPVFQIASLLSWIAGLLLALRTGHVAYGAWRRHDGADRPRWIASELKLKSRGNCNPGFLGRREIDVPESFKTEMRRRQAARDRQWKHADLIGDAGIVLLVIGVFFAAMTVFGTVTDPGQAGVQAPWSP